MKKFGFTEDQLQQLTFSSNTSDTPFEHWSFRIPNGVAAEAYRLLKAYCTLKWLILDNPPDSDHKRNANDYLAMTLAEADVVIGQRTRELQSRRAKKLRGNVGDNNMSISMIVETLCSKPEHQTETAKQLWNHFISELDVHSLSPKEHANETTKKFWCNYDFKGREKSISFGQFANLTSKARRRLKSGLPG
ncbi:hypothetical protein CJD38_17550 [Stenotrophobium rhamnosiphilum]|uniref:Uncharacterized protein n=1 Tax=Stenotrophobium rhamnosiphilum TaxID=2029166 RepID=A0A2T5MBN0_9GAMM|nr:hypothetical protein CJD38_17550 [Stenotrophobium rhamnosiphilum]